MTPTELESWMGKVVAGVQALADENALLKYQIAAGSTAVRSNRKKLTKRDVGLMKDLKRVGSTNAELAEAFQVNPATVSRIIRGIYHA
jgi:DNA-binding NarL/FixJ family response regulator